VANVFITTHDDCEGVRELLDLAEDSRTLPDNVVLRDTVAGMAERWVKARTLNQDLNTEAGQRAKSAALHYAAGLLVTRKPWVRTLEQPGGRFSRQDVDLEAKRDDLFAVAESEVLRSEELNKTVEEPPDEDSGPYILFGVASVARDRVEGTEVPRPWWEE
jgi:hypothetical protein